eukprot:tig00001366_g8397.t1
MRRAYVQPPSAAALALQLARALALCGVLVLGSLADETSAPPIVTAASTSYFDRLQNLVASVQLWEPERLIVVYDVGLSASQAAEVSEWKSVELRSFKFDAAPRHAAFHDTYAFKQGPPSCWSSIRLHFENRGGQDAGQELEGPLREVDETLRSRGAFFVEASSPIAAFTHPLTLRWLNASASEFEGQLQCAGGIQGYVAGSTAAREVLEAAARCAAEEPCIAPPGSDASNHRQDQSVFSVLIRRGGFPCEADRRFSESNPLRAPASPAGALARHRRALAGAPLDPPTVLFSRRWMHPKPYAPLLRRGASPRPPSRGEGPYSRPWTPGAVAPVVVETIEGRRVPAAAREALAGCLAARKDEADALAACAALVLPESAGRARGARGRALEALQRARGAAEGAGLDPACLALAAACLALLFGAGVLLGGPLRHRRRRLR